MTFLALGAKWGREVSPECKVLSAELGVLPARAKGRLPARVAKAAMPRAFLPRDRNWRRVSERMYCSIGVIFGPRSPRCRLAHTLILREPSGDRRICVKGGALHSHTDSS